MYLKELTINGFKSFAKKSELDFSTPITAIVGPNGSGKSNVAESFRFVLGEQSPSRMRGKKGEDLIFNGSESTARLNRASVSITLNNEKKIFPLDFDEITIERAVFRDGTNEYSINGSRTRLKDVQELLAVANIGSTGHHIISQGEADRILSANPKERREMIEDALGLKIFQYKKQESEKKLKKTLENIAQVESLRREVQPHLKFLERQVKKIEKSLELKEELKRMYAEYLKREDSYLTLREKELRNLRREPEERLQVLERELSAAKERLQQTEKDEKSNALIALEEKIAGLRKERQEIVRESGRLEGQIEFLKRRIEERRGAETEIDSKPIPYALVRKAAESAEATFQTVQESSDVNLIRKTLGEVILLFRNLLESGSAHEMHTEREEKELAEIHLEKETLDKKLAGFTGRENELQQSYEALRASIEAEHSASREAEHEVFRIMNEEREIETVLMRIDEDLKMLERDRVEFKRELQEALVLIGSSASAYASHEIDLDSTEERSMQIGRRRELEKMKIRLEELGGGETDEVLKEYQDVKERDEFLIHEIEDLNQSVTKLEELIADLARQLNEQFVTGIEKIDTEFNRFFALMFGGGQAKLLRMIPKVRKPKKLLEEEMEEEIEAEDEAQEEGIEIDVKLPNKRVRGLDMLSGGERALTSIALIFAMSQINPPLFIILDETDAALDEANSRRYGDMIEALAKRSQLILITHNRETMSRAGVLYGVTMGGDGISKLLSVRFEDALAVAK
jgi:chromosome segregation ATPase